MFKSNLDYKNVYEALIKELKNYVKKCNLHGAVLGVSGGIDSTVVAAISEEVERQLNEEKYQFKLLGITMPTNTTFGEEFDAANAVLHAFFHDSTTYRIDKIYNEFSEGIWNSHFNGDSWGENSKGDVLNLRRGNIKSRIRMVLLYDAAKAVNGIVLGTDNYSEYLLGFSTIGGDALFDYCPIQYMWKTEVFGLAKYIESLYSNSDLFVDKKKAEAIKMSLALKPMDGLGISGDDMEQIGAKDYLEVDTILYNHINGIEKAPEVSEETEKKVLNRMRWTEYKRNHPVRVQRSVYEQKKEE